MLLNRYYAPVKEMYSLQSLKKKIKKCKKNDLENYMRDIVRGTFQQFVLELVDPR